MDFRLVSNYEPRGDQATAIDALVRGVRDREEHQVLLGVTGSGKTYTMAKVIEQLNRPALVLATTRPWRHSFIMSSSSSSPTTRSNTLSPITTTTSPKLIFLQVTSI